MTTFYTATLGCKINQYETRAIGEAWSGGDAREVETPQEADLILVNSCAVTANAVADLRQTVRRFHRDNPEADIIITGCAAQILPEELAQLPGVIRVVSQEDKPQLLDGPEGSSDHAGEKPVFAPFSINGYGRARAVVKVQDGCSHNCTYCIIPLTRGKSISRPVNDILDEVSRLLAAGFREFILSGINLRHFGARIEGKDRLLGSGVAAGRHVWSELGGKSAVPYFFGGAGATDGQGARRVGTFFHGLSPAAFVTAKWRS